MANQRESGSVLLWGLLFYLCGLASLGMKSLQISTKFITSNMSILMGVVSSRMTPPTSMRAHWMVWWRFDESYTMATDLSLIEHLWEISETFYTIKTLMKQICFGRTVFISPVQLQRLVGSVGARWNGSFSGDLWWPYKHTFKVVKHCCFKFKHCKF